MLLGSKHTCTDIFVRSQQKPDKNMSTRTQKAFMAGGNNTVLLLRGQLQFCGQRGYIQKMLLLYMFITLRWKNKRLRHRHFLGSSLPQPSLQACVGRRQSAFRWGLSTCHTSSFSEILIFLFISQPPFTIELLFLRPPLNICYFYCLDSSSADPWNFLVYFKCWFRVASVTWESKQTIFEG